MEEILRQILGELTLIRQRLYDSPQSPPVKIKSEPAAPPLATSEPEVKSNSEPESAPDIETLKRLFTHGVNIGKKQDLKLMLESRYGISKLIELPESKRLECYTIAEKIIDGEIPF